MSKQETVGYDKKFKAEDPTVAKLRQKYGLPEEASMAEIEAKAIELLKNPLTSIDTAQLMLNRKVDGNEQMIFVPDMPAGQKVALLIMKAEIEKSMAEKGITDFGITKKLGKE